MKKLLIFIFISGVILSSCSIKAPEVTVTGEKTALENQVIGTFEKIENETWLVASVRSSGKRKKTDISAEQQRVLEAVRNRKFNLDEINEYKHDGIVGENNHGLLELRLAGGKADDPEYKRRVKELVAEENQDRKIIMNRVYEINEEAAEVGKDKVYQIFASMHQDQTKPGEWIQLESGAWIQKEKSAP